MNQFLHGLADGLIGIVALFFWVPCVWIAFKLIQWMRESTERTIEEHRTALKQAPNWEKTPDYWARTQPLPLSDDPVATGDFYVVTRECISCGTPASVAPDLIAHHRDSAGGTIVGHCYFRKQPSTPEETEEAINAVNASCACAVRYRGNDPSILARISPMSVDNPFRLRTHK